MHRVVGEECSCCFRGIWPSRAEGGREAVRVKEETESEKVHSL